MSLCPRSDLNRRQLSEMQDQLRQFEKRLEELESAPSPADVPVLASWSTLPDRIEEIELRLKHFEQYEPRLRKLEELEQRIGKINKSVSAGRSARHEKTLSDIPEEPRAEKTV